MNASLFVLVHFSHSFQDVSAVSTADHQDIQYLVSVSVSFQFKVSTEVCEKVSKYRKFIITSSTKVLTM